MAPVNGVFALAPTYLPLLHHVQKLDFKSLPTYEPNQVSFNILCQLLNYITLSVIYVHFNFLFLGFLPALRR